MTINIAVAGHVSSGKTTLIRTFTRQPIGDVDDLANVTKKGQIYFYEGLQANFIDTPGFQYPSIALDYLDNETLSLRNREKSTYDIEAIDSIKRSDVVIYLGNLSVVPNDNHKDEIDVVKKIQPRIIAVLNQYHSNEKASSKTKVQKRCDKWTEVFKEKGITNVIIFDAHWDRRSKEQDIYDAIYSNLDNDVLKSDFKTGLNQFKDRQSKIRKDAYTELAKSIEELQGIVLKVNKCEYDTQNKSKSEYNSNSEDNQHNQKIGRLIYKDISGFIAYTTKLYNSAAETPTASAEKLIMDTKRTVNIPARIGVGAGGSAILGTIFTIFGGVIGAMITGIASGGLATIPGAIEGAKIFGMLGTAIGTIPIFIDAEDHIEITITSEKIQDHFMYLLAIIWGLEHNCYGRNEKLSEEEVKNMISQLKKSTMNLSNINWKKIKSKEIIDYCHEIFADLEK